MTYRLRLDPTVHEIYRALPDQARANLATALLDAMHDPIGASAPYGHDDGVIRTVARGLTTAVILIDDKTQSITVIHIASAD